MASGRETLLRVETLVLHSPEPRRLAEFWLALLGYEVTPNYTESIQLADPENHGPPLLIAQGEGPFGPGAVHLDLRPKNQARAVELALSLGATRTSGSTEQSWVVLADPDGNRFCILQEEDAYETWRRSTSRPFGKSR